MFVECIRGRVRDREALERARVRWETELRPDAVGFLGSTGGLTPAGEALVLARFESAALAAENGARPAQDAWWQELVAAFDGEPTVRDTEDVDVMFERGCDGAGFVQIMTGSADAAALKDLNRRFAAEAAHLRPDLIGSYCCFFADGTFADVNYFTSQADARAAEAAEMPEAVQHLIGELRTTVRDLEYHDLADPWIV